MNPFNGPTPPAHVRAADGGIVYVPTFPKIRAWSYSVVNQHAKCPQAVKFRKIDRLPEPDSEAIARGMGIHEQLAHLVRTGEFPEGATIPHREAWRKRLLYLHVGGAQAEMQVAFDKDWNQVPWFGANVWGRVIIDALLVRTDFVRVHEFKTGKVYPEHEKQKRLYALAAMKLHPEQGSFIVGCDYIDLPDRADELTKFTRAQEKDLEQEFYDFAAPLLAETIYPAAPGTHCRWCHFRKSNAGPCTFG